MNRRIGLPLFTIAASVLLLFTLAGCGQKTVRVETGERIVCTYGEVLTDTVKAIEVPVAKVDKYGIVSKTVTCELHRRLEVLYAEAQTAIAAGDLETAKIKLAEIVKADSSFRKAQEQLDAIEAGKTPAKDTNTAISPAETGTNAGTNTGTGTTGGSGESEPEPIGPVASLKPWVPDRLTGYTATPIIADVYTLTREYKPGPSSPVDSLVIVVEQYANAADVKSAIANSIGSDYSENASNATVEGRAVRFGTDGHRFATVAWGEGGLLVVIEGGSEAGSPERLKSHLLSLVAEIVK